MSILTDLSYWNGLPYDESPDDSAIDYDTLASQSPDGVIPRAGLAQFEDLRFGQNTSELRARGVWTGAYWYTVDDVNGAWQAEAFLSVIEGLAFPPLPLSDGTLLPGLWLDAEDNSAGLSQAALSGRYKLFLETVKAERPNEPIGIYTRASFWVPNTGAPAWAGAYPLWIARYYKPLPWGNPDDPPWTEPVSWNTYHLHQFSADGNMLGALYGVRSSSIDLNQFKPGVTVLPPPENNPPGVGFELDCPPLPTLTVVSETLNIRAGPGVGHIDVGDLHQDDVVTVYDVSVNSAFSVWVRIDPDIDNQKWCAAVHGGKAYLG